MKNYLLKITLKKKTADAFLDKYDAQTKENYFQGIKHIFRSRYQYFSEITAFESELKEKLMTININTSNGDVDNLILKSYFGNAIILLTISVEGYRLICTSIELLKEVDKFAGDSGSALISFEIIKDGIQPYGNEKLLNDFDQYTNLVEVQNEATHSIVLESANEVEITVDESKIEELSSVESMVIENSHHVSDKFFVSARFKQDFYTIKDLNTRKKAIEILSEIANIVTERPHKLSAYLISLRSKKFVNASRFWKFYVTSAHRIIYTFGKDIGRYDEADSIFILRYVSDHDRQSLVANKTRENIDKYRFYNQLGLSDSGNDDVDEDAIDQSLLENYDIETEIVYSALPWQLEKFLVENVVPSRVLLNTEQTKCVNHKFPIVVKGSAGSGKTLVSIEVMNIASQITSDAKYLTLSDGLKNYSRKQFEAIINDSSNQFFTIIDYCLINLGLSISNFVDFRVFESWYSCSYSHLKYNAIDVWAEIRGIIKGYMGSDWHQNKQKSLMDKADYLNGTDFESGYDSVERDQIYSICIKYHQWLLDNGNFDDNDLAFRMIRGAEDGRISKEKLLVVDEIQDFTEKQILMLLSISENDRLFLSGDPNQIINPTYFSFERVSTLFFLKNKEAVKILNLKNNYRNSYQIVKFMNEISIGRKKYIGHKKTEDDELDIPMKANDGSIRLLYVQPCHNNMSALIKLFNEIPNVAIIVSTEKEKNKIVNKFHMEMNCIYTIAEAKGLEFSHVLCLNFISNEISKWNDILSGKGKRSSKHRQLLNNYYVLVSRAKEYVVFYEHQELIPFSIDTDKRSVSEVTLENLCLDSNIDPFEWYYEGEKFERAGMYARAIISYKKFAQMTNNPISKDLLRCEALLQMETDNSSESHLIAANKMMKAKEYRMAEDIFAKLGIKYKVLECKMRTSGSKNYERFSSEIKTHLQDGIEDHEFVEFVTDYYFKHRINKHVSNCEVISHILVNDLIEVN